jgi:plastocyanin
LNTKRALKRLAVPVVAGGAAALVITGGAFASPHNGHGQHLSSKPGYIVAKGHSDKKFRFSSTTIERGKKLHIVNNTPAPHSVTLVIPKLVPQTKGQQKKCFTQGHICLKAAKWHKFDGQNIHRNPVRAGKHGWDEAGSLHREGDSVLFGGPFGPNPKNRKVTAPAGTVLHFMCIIHPWMHGKITVTN